MAVMARSEIGVLYDLVWKPGFAKDEQLAADYDARLGELIDSPTPHTFTIGYVDGVSCISPHPFPPLKCS